MNIARVKDGELESWRAEGKGKCVRACERCRPSCARFDAPTCWPRTLLPRRRVTMARISLRVCSGLRGGFFSTLLQYPRPHPLNQARAPCGENNLDAAVRRFCAQLPRFSYRAFFPVVYEACPCHRRLPGRHIVICYVAYATRPWRRVLPSWSPRRRFSSRFFCTRLAQWH